MTIRTVGGYDFFEVSSAMQKAIRRADAAVAGFFALELWTSGYRDYVWKRLFTISAEARIFRSKNSLKIQVSQLFCNFAAFDNK